MLKVGQPNENKVLKVEVNKKLTMEDYDKYLPELKSLFNQYDELRFYIVLEDFFGFELEALLEELKFDYKYRDQFGKTAIVGDKQWEEWLANFSGLFVESQMNFFEKEQREEAWEWVNR